jgi:hypothetical protein
MKRSVWRVRKECPAEEASPRASWLALDRRAHFQEEIDRSTQLGGPSIRKVCRDG